MKLRVGDIVFGVILIAIGIFLATPDTRDIFIKYTSGNYKLIGAFFKFAILASMGDMLGLRLRQGEWKLTTGFFYKAIVWGFIGVVIVLIFGIFTSGISSLQEQNLLPSASMDTFGGKLLFAFFVSAFMNLTFAPAFMGFHKFTDTYIEMKITSKEKTTCKKALESINWHAFVGFVVLKTIPFFWIPAHTITFLLPEEFQVIFAAVLGIALGLLLGLANTNKGKKD